LSAASLNIFNENLLKNVWLVSFFVLPLHPLLEKSRIKELNKWLKNSGDFGKESGIDL